MGTAGQPGVGLRRLRLLAGMSLRELADAAGVSHMVIQRAEQGLPVSMTTRDALARILGTDVHRVIVMRPRMTNAGMNPVVAARHAQGLPRRHAAKQIGVSDKTLARVEAGLPVRPVNAKRIALALGLKVSVVLDLTHADLNGEAA
jgi:transcriptional regulator with XRE-family HTH domain